MAITTDFSKKYAHLICEDIPVIRLGSYPNNIPVPEKYRKNFIYTENGFVKLFCEEYDEPAKRNIQNQ